MEARHARIAGALLAAALSAPAAAAELPPPFQRFDDGAIVDLLPLPGDVRATVRETAVISPQDARRLIALLEVDGGRRTYELAEFGLERGALVLAARHAEQGRWDDTHGLDLAPYQLTRERRAVGVRYQTMVTGGTAVVLVLYLRTGNTFAPVFSRIVRYSAMETDEESFAVVQIVPGRSEYRDLRVVETTGEGRTIRERWTWDEAARAYRLSRRQIRRSGMSSATDVRRAPGSTSRDQGLRRRGRMPADMGGTALAQRRRQYP